MTIVLDVAAEAADTAAVFWAGVTASRLSAWRGPAGEFATLEPPEGDAYVRLQRVRKGDGGCHLDMHIDPGAESLGEASDRVAGLGARVRHREADLVTLESPGGFTFCLVPWDGEATVPAPVRGDAGASRLDQLCLDAPPDLYETECAFWEAVTGWPQRSATRPEYRHLVQPRDAPVRLLLQRRERAQHGERVSAHIDFGCEHNARLAEQHTAAGARAVAAFPSWITMSDPIGRPYCLTTRDPAPGDL